MPTTMIDTKPATNGQAPATTQAAKSKRTVDPSQRRAEIVIAALFLLTAATSIPAAFALDPMLNVPDYLARIFQAGQHSSWMPCCGRSTTLGLSLSRCLRFPCSENSMKPWRSATWLPGSSRAPS